jgi:hypothetical protein
MNMHFAFAALLALTVQIQMQPVQQMQLVQSAE